MLAVLEPLGKCSLGKFGRKVSGHIGPSKGKDILWLGMQRNRKEMASLRSGKRNGGH